MKIERERIKLYLYDIKKNTKEIEDYLKQSDAEILDNKVLLKAIKYMLIEIAESMANVLQHVLAREFGTPVAGYLDTIKKAKEKKVLSQKMCKNLTPFFKFRHALIHRYWIMDDKKILSNLRKGYKDFNNFIIEIEKSFLKSRGKRK
jgi:uncharacterized protein YutE (UPF0331/DUF86 family)